MPFEPQRLPLQNVGAGGNIERGGLRVAAGDVVVEGVDALEDGDLVLTQLQGVPRLSLRIWRANSNLGDHYPLPVGELGEGVVQQVHVQEPGRLVVNVPSAFRGAVRRSRVLK